MWKSKIFYRPFEGKIRQSRLTRYFALASLLGVLSTATAATAQSKQLASLNQPAPSSSRTSTAETAQADSSAKFRGANGSGTLLAMIGEGKELGQCPLKHTDVSSDISGYIARVTVKQTFHNPFKDKIEAVYTFPLSDSGAIDEMLMKIGDHTIHGSIKKT